MYGGHTGKERYIPRHLTANKISPSVCECLPAVQLLSGCATACSVNRKGKRPTQNWLHVQTCYQIKKTFHEYNLDDSVDVARSYALLLYGKNGRDVDTFEDHDNRQIRNNASAIRRCIQRACPLCQISCFDVVQEPRPKPTADRTSWS